MIVQKLKDAIEGQVFSDSETFEEVRTDFGRIVSRIPPAVVLPASPEDVQRVVEMAFREGWSVSTRGGSHSQSGQSLNQGGVLLDTTSLNKIGHVEGDSVWVQAGTLWGDLVKHVYPSGWLPRVLTNNLNVTIGGTLSMAGLGVASHLFGTQADNVDELEVVTGQGELVRCSPTSNAALFDCSRCGLGQFSIITGARVKLRKCLPQTRTFYLLYDDLAVLMRDQEQIIDRGRFHYVESWCAPCPQGFRKVGETKLPFAEWFFPMQLTLEHSGHVDDADLLSGLHFYRKIHFEDSSTLEFANRLEPLFQLWKAGGAWELAHPWMELVLPWDRAAAYIQGVLKSFPPNLLVGGHVLLWPCRGTVSKAPLFMHPGGDLVMGFGILPAVPKQFVPMALPLLNRASDLGMQVGGKRYLSGWVEFDQERWKQHFGPMWSQVRQWKSFYDPAGILNPGFVDFSLPED